MDRLVRLVYKKASRAPLLLPSGQPLSTPLLLSLLEGVCQALTEDPLGATYTSASEVVLGEGMARTVKEAMNM